MNLSTLCFSLGRLNVSARLRMSLEFSRSRLVWRYLEQRLTTACTCRKYMFSDAKKQHKKYNFSPEVEKQRPELAGYLLETTLVSRCR